ncbi:MAG TPA: rod shape-determining protein MreC [Bacillota bacterium]|nr:rod shape-determining protein MreC [Bacillota bacterium]
MNRPHYIVLGLVVLVTLVILNLPAKATARVKLCMGSLVVPLFGLANSSQQLAGNAADRILPRGELLRQNETLRRDNQQLRLQLMQAEETLHENDRLRQFFAWQRQKTWKVRLASVVLREPANWWRTVQIDLGSRDGVRVNMPVLTTDGLVGRIASVSLTRSQVVLLGDPNCRVSGLVENEARDTGVIGASGPLDSSLVEMGYLSRNITLKPGQDVVTSGLGGIFPKGIPIGKVVDSHPVEYGLYTVARVKLAANLSAIEEVWVMFEP